MDPLHAVVDADVDLAQDVIQLPHTLPLGLNTEIFLFKKTEVFHLVCTLSQRKSIFRVIT